MIPSCSTITWGKLEQPRQFEDSLASIKGIGYSDIGIEFPMLPPAIKANPSLAGKAAEREGLSVSGVAIDTSPSMAGIVRQLNSSMGWLCLFERDFDLAIEKTRKLLDACSESRVSVALHPHVRSNIESVEELDRIMLACAPNKLNVCADTAHLTALDIDVSKFITRYRKVISLVHFKDLRVKKAQYKVDDFTDFVDLGEGVADLKGALNALREIEYTGAIMAEVDHPKEGNPLQSARKNYAYLDSLAHSSRN